MSSTPTPIAAPGAPRNRTQLVLLAMLFFVPLIASFVLYFGFPQLRPSGTTNYGELIVPARPITGQAWVDAGGSAVDQHLFSVRWTLVTLGGTSCDEACVKKLVLTRQLRLAMNEKRSRIQRVLVLEDPAALAATAERLAVDEPDLKVVAERGPPGQRMADFLGHRDAVTFLFDPNGNWVMAYPTGRETLIDFKGMQKDLKKLLMLSQIG